MVHRIFCFRINDEKMLKLGTLLLFQQIIETFNLKVVIFSQFYK